MLNLKGACIIAQSGGPTAVINSSVLGVIDAALQSSSITGIYGAAHGIRGIISDVIYDLRLEDPRELALLRNTPSAILGSCRYRLKNPEQASDDYEKILQTFQKYNIRYFFYNGGNDSMDTCNKISKYMMSKNYDCMIIGIPKTIDNDLCGTDHCPGYGSAAKYIATASMEICRDANVYDTGTVTILEIMGRNAGWLAAASALASNAGCGPDLIYLPETDFDIDRTLNDISVIYGQNSKCVVALSEGIHDKDGKLISEYNSEYNRSVDSFGHIQMGGLASNFAAIVKKKLGIPKVRGVEFSLTQRCAAHCASRTDVDEAYMAGRAAVEFAVSGVTDKMVAFERSVKDGRYHCNIKLTDLNIAANAEKKIPDNWINSNGNGVTSEFIEYAQPLIQGEVNVPFVNGLPRFATLKQQPPKYPSVVCTNVVFRENGVLSLK